MPLLPTLATVALLATASLFCPSQDAPAPDAAPATVPRMLPASGGVSLALIDRAMTDGGMSVHGAAPRPPAAIAFLEIYPVTAADPLTTSAIPSASPVTRSAAAAPAPKPSRRLAASSRRPCAGRHCEEAPFGAAKPGPALPGAVEEPAPAASVPGALPFAETVADAVMPVAREVGTSIGARVERIAGGAGDLVRGGQSVVRGSVASLADRLF